MSKFPNLNGLKRVSGFKWRRTTKCQNNEILAEYKRKIFTRGKKRKIIRERYGKIPGRKA